MRGFFTKYSRAPRSANEEIPISVQKSIINSEQKSEFLRSPKLIISEQKSEFLSSPTAMHDHM